MVWRSGRLKARGEGAPPASRTKRVIGGGVQWRKQYFAEAGPRAKRLLAKGWQVKDGEGTEDARGGSRVAPILTCSLHRSRPGAARTSLRSRWEIPPSVDPKPIRTAMRSPTSRSSSSGPRPRPATRAVHSGLSRSTRHAGLRLIHSFVSGQPDFEVLTDLAGEKIEDFATTWDGTDGPSPAVDVNRVVAALPKELATVLFQVPDEVSALHAAVKANGSRITS